jgi:hypothetical protein
MNPCHKKSSKGERHKNFLLKNYSVIVLKIQSIKKKIKIQN